MLRRLKVWAGRVVAELHAVYLAARDPRTPWYARLVAAAVAAYALSPIDLVPDFIPVLGFLDDLVIIPLGVLLAARLVPAEVLADCRGRAGQSGALPVSRAGAAVVAGLWAVGLGAGAILAVRFAT